MATKQRRKSAPTTDLARSTNAAKSTVRVAFETRAAQFRPLRTAIAAQYPIIRWWMADSSFLAMFMPLKLSVYNYGLQILPEEGADPAKLKEWLAQPAAISVPEITDPATQQLIEIESLKTNEEMIRKFIDDVWMEWFMFDSVTTLWTESISYPVVLAIEKLEYTDNFGIEIVRYNHGLSQLEIQQLPKDMQDRFKTPRIVLNPKFGEHFRVMKRARTGDGLGIPNIYSIFRLLDEIDAKEFGYQSMSYFFRKATRHHKLGHQITNGERAGKPQHFWNKNRDTAVKNCFSNVVGPDDFTSNFDHEIDFPWPDPKVFDEVVWKGSDRRIYQWAGPLGQMMIAGGVQNYIPQLLKAHATEERNRMNQFLSMVIFNAFDPPCKQLRLTWDSTIFNDARLQAELTKFGVQQGYVSNTSAKEQMGFDPQREEARKVGEATDPDVAKKQYPLWDTSHALAPAQGESSVAMAAVKASAKGKAPGSTSGNPPGTQHSDRQG